MLLNEAKNKNLFEIHNYQKIVETFFDESPLGLFILKQEGIILKANKSASDNLGVETSSLTGKHFSRYISPECQKEFSKYLLSLSQSSDKIVCEIKMLQRNNPLFFATILGKKVTCNQTKTINFLFIILEINNRKKNQSEKLAPPPDNNIVNHINQPLAIIANYIYGCINRLECKNYRIADVLQALKQAEHELHRITEIIMRIKNFSCKDSFQYEDVDIDTLIKEIIPIVNHEIIQYQVLIEYRSAKGLPKITLDKLYIQQAILNLARNAVDAMRNVNQYARKLIIEVNRQSKHTIEISLMDNGPAFQIESMHQLFDPEFTTRPYGIGLGLAIARIIIESHGGKLLSTLNPTGGACFKLELPMTATAIK